MLVLAVYTTTPGGSVALLEDETLLGEVGIESATTHSARLLRSVDFLVGAHGRDIKEMLVAAELSVRRGLCPPEDAERLQTLLRRLDLIPSNRPSPELLETYIVRDKKMRDGVLQFVLTTGVGSVTLAPVSNRDELRDALHSVQESFSVPQKPGSIG